MTSSRSTMTWLALAVAATMLPIADRTVRSDIAPPPPLPAISEPKSRRALGSTSRDVPATPRLRLRFTAPVDATQPDSTRGDWRQSRTVHHYEFLQVNQYGITTTVRGYADSLGLRILTPHRPGTRETVWLDAVDTEMSKTIFVLSRGWSGRPSARSNGYAVAAVLSTGTPGASTAGQ